jgi:hypothetical protein
MKEDNPDGIQNDNPCGFDSRDCIIHVFDGPSDPVDPNEPIDPKLLAVLTAEREKIAHWTAVRKQQAESGEGNKL